MATASQVIKAALQRIVVQASEAPIEPSEAQDFIFAMNNYMFDLDARGIALGYTVVGGLGDEITIPLGALRGLIANMAIEVAPDYDGQVSQALVLAASEGFKAMQRLGQIIPTSEFPGTLPIGSGNEGRHHRRESHFYADLEAQILAETTGSIGLETGTNEAAGD